MKLQLFPKCTSFTILRKFIKKAKENKNIEKSNSFIKETQDKGKFVYARVKFVRSPENKIMNVGIKKNLKFTISEINSLSSFNFFQVKPIAKEQKPIIKETISLVNNQI